MDDRNRDEESRRLDRDRLDRDPLERDPLGRGAAYRDREARHTWDRGGVRAWSGGDDDRMRQDEWDARDRDQREQRALSTERPYGDRDYTRPRREEVLPRPRVADRWQERADPSEYRDRARLRWDADQDYRRSRVVSQGPGYRADTSYDQRDEPGAWRRLRPEMRPAGPHAGKGPRGYRRSDARIHEEINDRLTAHAMIDATDIECRVENGDVTLTGFVDSRAVKHAAEDVAEDVSGVREVHNQLRLRSHAGEEGVGRTSVLGLTESRTQTAATADATAQSGPPDRSRTRR